MEILAGLAAVVTVIVGGIQLVKWWKERRSRTAMQTAQPPVEDRWVDMRYVEDAGIAQRLRDHGCRFGWVAANDEQRKIDLEGWEIVVDELPDGRRVRYKIRDDPIVGGYLILMKKCDG